MRTLIVATLSLTAGAAHADQQAPASAPAAGAPKVTEYTFRPEEVGGGTEGPGAEVVTGRTPTPLPSLIRTRQDFRRELLQDAERL